MSLRGMAYKSASFPWGFVPEKILFLYRIPWALACGIFYLSSFLEVLDTEQCLSGEWHLLNSN